MKRIVSIAYLCFALSASAQWSTWSEHWTHAEIRSNLWNAIGERIIVSTEEMAKTNDLVAPGWWVTKTWIDTFDQRLVSILSSFYDARKGDSYTKGYGTANFPVFTETNVLLYAGITNFMHFPTNGWWFPKYSDYKWRRDTLNAMTAVVHGVAWTTNSTDLNDAKAWADDATYQIMFGQEVFDEVSWTNWGECVDFVENTFDPQTNAAIGLPACSYSVGLWSTNLGYTTYGYGWHNGYSLPAFISWDEDEGGTITGHTDRVVSTNFSKSVRLMWAAYPMGKFSANGDGISTNWTPAGSDSEVYTKAISNWVWSTCIGHATLTDDPLNCDAPTNDNSTALGYVAVARFLTMWTADTNGFKYR